MHNLALDRIKRHIDGKVIAVKNNMISYPVKIENPNFPISCEELRRIIMSELGLQQQIPGAEQQPPKKEPIHFGSVYDFASWYSTNQTLFNDKQRVALDTVMQIRMAIEAGCRCKRDMRERAAHIYFADFWTKNKDTDLLKTISEVTGAPKVSVANICSYPPA